MEITETHTKKNGCQHAKKHTPEYTKSAEHHVPVVPHMSSSSVAQNTVSTPMIKHQNFQKRTNRIAHVIH